MPSQDFLVCVSSLWKKITPPFLINSIGSLSVLSSRVHCCTRYCAKNLAEPPLGSGSHPESAASPPPTAGVRWHRRPTARSSCSRLSTGRPCRWTPSGDARRGTFAVAPPPPCVLLPHIVSTNDQPRLLTSCRLSPIFPSSNSAPACTWPSSSRVLSSARRCAPPPPRSMPALPRVSPPTPDFPDSVQPGAVIFRAFPRANALAPAAPRVLPRRIPPLKASSSPRRRVALSRVLPDDPLPARSRDTFRPPASARNETYVA